MKTLSRFGAAIWRHKYFWTLVAFLVHVGFIDTNSLVQRYQLHAQNNALRSEIKSLDRDYAAAQQALNQLHSSQTAIEDVARVRLYMKTDQEDLYVIETR